MGPCQQGPLPCFQFNSLSLLNTQNIYLSKPQKTSITITIFYEENKEKIKRIKITDWDSWKFGLKFLWLVSSNTIQFFPLPLLSVRITEAIKIEQKFLCIYFSFNHEKSHWDVGMETMMSRVTQCTALKPQRIKDGIWWNHLLGKFIAFKQENGNLTSEIKTCLNIAHCWWSVDVVTENFTEKSAFIG